MAHDVFISHSEKNKTTGDAVCAMLESEGIRCWIAPRDVTPGMEWSECIIDAIEQTRVMVLVFTTDANTSPQIRREVERAVNHGVAILPLRIEDVLPGKALEYFIGNVHWLDALTPPLESHLKQLAAAIKLLLTRLPAREMPTEHQPASQSPEVLRTVPQGAEPDRPVTKPAPPALNAIAPAPEPPVTRPAPAAVETIQLKSEPTSAVDKLVPPLQPPPPSPSRPEVKEPRIEPAESEFPTFLAIGGVSSSKQTENSGTRKFTEWFSTGATVLRARTRISPVLAWGGAAASILVLVAVFAIRFESSSSAGSTPPAVAPPATAQPAIEPETAPTKPKERQSKPESRPAPHVNDLQTRSNSSIQQVQLQPVGEHPLPKATPISAGVAAGMLIYKNEPVYPPIARAARVSGTVVLKTTISKDGSIESLEVLSGPPMLQGAALDAVKTWRYRPFRINGQLVKVETTINVVFTLGG